MFNFIRNNFRRRALKQVSLKREGVPVFPQNGVPESLGVVCVVRKSDDIQAFEAIVDFITGQGITLCGVVVEIGNCFKKYSQGRSSFGEFCKEHGFVFVDKARIDWKGVPQNALLHDFWGKELDMLVCMNQEQDFTLDYITRGAKARFLAGMHSSANVAYDLILEQGKVILSPSEYIGRLFGYLKIMQNGE